MKEITKEEFLQAVDVIEKYQKQLNEQIKDIDLTSGDFFKHKENQLKTPVKLWLPYINQTISTRLRNVLIEERCVGYDSNDLMIWEAPFVYIEDIVRKDFLRVKNAGKGTWNEFVKFRGY